MTKTPKKAERRTLKQGTVGDQLGRIKWTLLPEDIWKNPNAQWVLSCDDLERHPERDEPSGLSDQLAYYAARQTIAAPLKERLPFYLATLFHIGRQWKISESLGREARRLQDEKNLIASEENLVAFAKQAGRALDPKLVQSSVVALSKVAAGQHDRALAQARYWWTIWANEVGELRKLVLAFREQAAQSQLGVWPDAFEVLQFFQRPSRIRYAFRVEGVQLEDEAEAKVQEGKPA